MSTAAAVDQRSATGPLIRRMQEDDIPAVVWLAARSFRGFRVDDDPDSDPSPEALEWVTGSYAGFPRMQYFVAELGDVVHGYILWTFHGGPRKDAVVELEQVASSVWSQERGLKIGRRMVKTIDKIATYLEERGRRLKMVWLSTRDGTGAGGFYVKVLGLRQVCVIPDMYRGNEAIYVRNFHDEPPGERGYVDWDGNGECFT